ncbi:MAG: hypothetical protein ACRDQZ_20840 [Mycobacteriales bacterium]
MNPTDVNAAADVAPPPSRPVTAGRAAQQLPPVDPRRKPRSRHWSDIAGTPDPA